MNHNEVLKAFVKLGNVADAEQMVKQKKNLSSARKSKKIIMEDFIDLKSRFQCSRGIFHSDGKQIVTNCYYLVIHHTDYNEEYENKTIKEGMSLDVEFPNYKRIISQFEQPEICDLFKIEDFAICSKMVRKNKIIQINEIAFYTNVIKAVYNFLRCYPEAMIYEKKGGGMFVAIDKETGDEIFFTKVNLLGKDKINYIYNSQDKIVIEQ